MNLRKHSASQSSDTLWLLKGSLKAPNRFNVCKPLEKVKNLTLDNDIIKISVSGFGLNVFYEL